LRGRAHRLVTGVCIVAPGGRELRFVEETVLHGRPDLSDAELAAYVASGEGSGCAGGYAIEGRGAQLFARIEGDYFNVIGLPLFRVVDALRGMGWRPDLAGVHA
jgi:septum formation protein